MATHTSRGDGWVVGQFALLGAIILAPRRLPGQGEWSPAVARAGRTLGVVSLGLGALLLALGGRHLGANLTPFPRPRDDGTLVQTGVYALVRHPLYLALTLAALGISLLRRSTPALLLVALLALFFDRKAALEEAWLTERFPEYAAYRQRVAKLLPFVY